MKHYVIFEVDANKGPYSLIGGNGVALVPDADPASPWQQAMRYAAELPSRLNPPNGGAAGDDVEPFVVEGQS